MKYHTTNTHIVLITLIRLCKFCWDSTFVDMLPWRQDAPRLVLGGRCNVHRVRTVLYLFVRRTYTAMCVCAYVCAYVCARSTLCTR